MNNQIQEAREIAEKIIGLNSWTALRLSDCHKLAKALLKITEGDVVIVPREDLKRWRGYLYERDEYGGLEEAEKNDALIKELSDLISQQVKDD